MELEMLDKDAEVSKGFAAQYRFLVGTTMKTFLTTFIDASTGSISNGLEKSRTVQLDGLAPMTVRGPVSMGGAAPGASCELFCHKAPEGKTKPCAAAERCEPGTVCLILVSITAALIHSPHVYVVDPLDSYNTSCRVPETRTFSLSLTRSTEYSSIGSASC